MKEERNYIDFSEIRPKTCVKAEVRFGGVSFKSKVLVQSLADGEELEDQSMKDFIRIADYQRGVVVATADDVVELNHQAALVANLLGNTFPFTELLTFYPETLKQALWFSRVMNKLKVFGGFEKEHLLYSDRSYDYIRESAERVFPDGFYYVYSGPTLQRRRKLFAKLEPCREDMQFSIHRTPDYRVKAPNLYPYYAGDHFERAGLFLEALYEYSGGELDGKIRIVMS